MKNKSLAARLLNGEGLNVLCAPDELRDVRDILSGERVTLRRTFNQEWPGQSPVKYWRVVGPATHPNINSDLSLEGLKEWGII